MTRTALITAVLLLPAACAPGRSGGEGTRPAGSPDVISQNQIQEVIREVSTAAQLIERLHPEWLRGRGMRSSGEADTPIVYLDGSRMGAIEHLVRIPLETVREIRFVSGTDASVRYGLGHGGGVISVSTVR